MFDGLLDTDVDTRWEPPPRIIHARGPFPDSLTCTFPMWNDKEATPKPPRFCNEPSTAKSLCEVHYRRVWHKAGE